MDKARNFLESFFQAGVARLTRAFNRLRQLNETESKGINPSEHISVDDVEPGRVENSIMEQLDKEEAESTAKNMMRNLSDRQHDD